MTAESAKRVLAAALATLLLVAACDSTQDRGNELPTTSVVETTASTVEEIAEAKGLTSDGPLLVAARAPDVINAARRFIVTRAKKLAADGDLQLVEMKEAA